MSRYYIIGTWTEWGKMEEMLPEKKGDTVAFSIRVQPSSLY